MTGNLPDDVTPADIDKHFGGSPDDYVVDYTVIVGVRATGHTEEQAKKHGRETIEDAVRQHDELAFVEAEASHIDRR